jgi:hypothetical protein
LIDPALVVDVVDKSLTPIVVPGGDLETAYPFDVVYEIE